MVLDKELDRQSTNDKTDIWTSRSQWCSFWQLTEQEMLINQQAQDYSNISAT